MATNDLADLNSRLATALRDTAHEVWVTGEKDEIIKNAVFQLWPRYSRPIDPAANVVELSPGDEYYALNAGVRAVSRADLYDPAGEAMGPVFGRAWEIVGDVMRDLGYFHISPALVTEGYTVKLHGYGIYDTATNLIPSEYAPLVLARARAEAYRRVAADRSKFKVWLARNQTQNMTVNELLELINEADAEANRLMASTPRTWQKPVSAWVG